jgi:hypothetical protein
MSLVCDGCRQKRAKCAPPACAVTEQNFMLVVDRDGTSAKCPPSARWLLRNPGSTLPPPSTGLRADTAAWLDQCLRRGT